MKYSICHPDKIVYCKELCRSCYEKHLRELNPEYYNRQKLNSLIWSHKNKDRKSIYDKERRKKVGVETDKRYYSSILNKFGILKEQYDQLVIKSSNTCNICGKPPHKGKRLHLDHNHSTNKIRGLLCSRCNWYLHTIETGENILEKIKNYLNE